jgi:iron complex outermembrane receptor protein
VDILGATFWETFPVDVEQIERIEVVRGPGSALYGANAFAGVINIITKKPGDGRSGMRAGVGSNGNVFGSATVTRRDGDFAYRVNAGYTREPSWRREVGPGRVDTQYFPHSDQNLGSSNARFALEGTRRLGKATELTVGGSYVDLFRNMQSKGPYNEYDIRGSVTDIHSSLTSKNVNVRLFYTHLDVLGGKAHEYSGNLLQLASPRSNVFDVFAEYVDQIPTGPVVNELHAGVNYRLKEVSWSYLDRERKENWIGAFLQDTARVSKSFQVVASLRADYVPFLDRVVPAPRGSIIYKPTDLSAVRLSGATAFRSPSFLESYLNLEVPAPSASGAALSSTTKRVDDPSYKLSEEKVVSVDLGYLNQDFDAVNFEITGYYVRVKDLIDLRQSQQETPNTNVLNGLFPTSGRYEAGLGGWENQCGVYNSFGSEIGARVFPKEGLDFFANYTLNLQRFDRPDGCLVVENRQTSTHKANAGVQVRTSPGIDGELTFHYSSSQNWTEIQVPTDGSVSLVPRVYEIPAYALVNARIGYRLLRDQVEVSATAFNLLNNQHREHPLGQRLGQRFMGFVSYRF